MKLRNFKVLTSAALAALALLATPSCIRDVNTAEFGEEGIPVTIQFNPVSEEPSASKTRAGYRDPGGNELDPGDGTDNTSAVGAAADREITHLRVLLYKSTTGELVKEFFSVIDNDENTLPVTAKVVTGTYDVVFITNETGTRAEDVFTPGDNTKYNLLGKLDAALFDEEDYDAAKPIPMYEIVRGATIVADNHVEIGGVKQPNPWAPSITRTGIRLSLEITLQPGQYAQWKAAPEITVSNIPPVVYLPPGIYNGTESGQERTEQAGAAADDLPGVVVFLKEEDGEMVETTVEAEAEEVKVYYDRIILPELLFEDKADEDLAMELSMSFAGEEKMAKISAPNPETEGTWGYTLPRNTWLHLNVTVLANELKVDPEVLRWNTSSTTGNPNDRYWIKAEPHPVYIAGTGWVEKFTATTNHPSGVIGLLDGDGNPSDAWITGVAVSTVTPGTETSAIVEVTAERHTSATPRTGYIYLTAGTGDGKIITRVTVIQTRQNPLASPGVIGYVASGPDRGKLTLRGSREYRLDDEIAAAADEMFPDQGLHEETVYVAYFKWGSLVAIDSNLGDFSADQVVWAPDDYTYNDGGDIYTGAEAFRVQIGDLTGDPAWTMVPFRDGAEAFEQAWNEGAPGSALGDPCSHYFGDGWHLPTGTPWNGGTFGTNTANSGATAWASSPAEWVTLHPDLPAGARAGRTSDGTADWSMFLPLSGHRREDGYVGSQIEGHYWSSTPRNETYSSSLWFNQSQGVAPSVTDRYPFTNSLPIRCVPPAPLPQGVRAPFGVIGYYAEDGPDGRKKGALTLEGDASLQEEHGYGNGTSPVPVYVAYFKFGSLVATSSDVTPTGDFTSDDIIASPPIWKNLAAAKEYIGNDWTKVPAITPDHGLQQGDEIADHEDILNGIGDACAYWFGDDGWRMPTNIENNKFVGGLATGTDRQIFWKTWSPGDGFYGYYTTAYFLPSSYGEFDFWDADATHAGTISDPHTSSFPVVDNAIDYPGIFAFSQVLPAAWCRDRDGFVEGSYQGSYGEYWSSTVFDDYRGYRMSFSSTSLKMSNDYPNAYALSIRCIQPPVPVDPFVQTFTQTTSDVPVTARGYYFIEAWGGDGGKGNGGGQPTQVGAGGSSLPQAGLFHFGGIETLHVQVGTAGGDAGANYGTGGKTGGLGGEPGLGAWFGPGGRGGAGGDGRDKTGGYIPGGGGGGGGGGASGVLHGGKGLSNIILASGGGGGGGGQGGTIDTGGKGGNSGTNGNDAIPGPNDGGGGGVGIVANSSEGRTGDRGGHSSEYSTIYRGRGGGGGGAGGGGWNGTGGGGVQGHGGTPNQNNEERSQAGGGGAGGASFVGGTGYIPPGSFTPDLADAVDNRTSIPDYPATPDRTGGRGFVVITYLGSELN